MYRALYEYKTDLKNYLSFVAGDQFTVLESKQKDWFLAQNGFGEIGYIPKSYVVREEVAQSDVLKSIDRAIEVIHYQAGSKGGQYTHAQRQNLAKLIQHRESVVDNYENQPRPTASTSQQDDTVQLRNKSTRRVAPEPPSRISSIDNQQRSSQELRNSTSETTRAISDQVDSNSAVVALDRNSVQNRSSLAVKDSCQTVETASSPVNFPSEGSIDSDTKCENSGLIDINAINVPDSLGHELVEEVRKNTGLSYQSSLVAVETVLGHICFKVPDVAPLLDRIFTTVQLENKTNYEEEEVSPDYVRLKELFSDLAECKDDSQQRSWALHEDEAYINSSLEEMLSILENSKKSVAKKAISGENYECVHTLVQYYQMETRVPLRLTLLKIFNATCVLDVTVVSQLLFSILTTELAQELQGNIADVQRSSYVSLALAMLFSTGDTVPANLHDHLNADFLRFVFDTIENPPSLDHEEFLSDILVNFILAFNLHFKQTEQNLVMDVMAEKCTVKVFSEKILLLFNRGEDPVIMFEHEPRPPNSVMKLLQDMYSDPKTSTVIYTNDQKVLIDIILGHLVDLSPGDQNRTNHLRLMQLFITNSDYVEHQHRVKELKQCLKRIQDEEESGPDKDIVADIFESTQVFS